MQFRALTLCPTVKDGCWARGGPLTSVYSSVSSGILVSITYLLQEKLEQYAPKDFIFSKHVFCLISPFHLVQINGFYLENYRHFEAILLEWCLRVGKLSCRLDNGYTKRPMT